MTATIYLIKLNDIPKYVGFTTKSIEHRWNEHCRDMTRGSHNILHNSIRKHGKDAFTIEPIYIGEDDQHTLKVMESKFILEHKTFYGIGTGYNMTLGGDGNLGYRHNEATRMKISLSAKNKRTHLSAEHRLKLSLLKRGKSHSEETRHKISLALRKMKKNTSSNPQTL